MRCRWALVGLAVLALGAGCGGSEQRHPDATEDINSASDTAGGEGDAAPDTDVGELDATVHFSFAVLADPHLDGKPGHREYLVRAVDRLIAERDARQIELVFILGDIAWGGTPELSNLEDAKGILVGLEEAGMRYIPVLGDNEVGAGEEQEFHEVFGAHYLDLAGQLEGWRQLPTPVDGWYLQSFSFEHRGCHFVSPDFISREPGNQAAELHDFVGGTWPWFQADIVAAAQGPVERINVFTHHGMFQTSLPSVDRLLISTEDMEQIVEFLCPYRDHMAASYGGHIHQNWVWETSCSTGELIYEVWSTDDGFESVVPPEPDDERITIRVVEVSGSADGFVYEQHLLVEPISIK